MKLLIAGLIAASTVTIAAPALAQSVYFGPNGVGVGVGGHPYGDGYYRGRDAYFGRRPMYEGRSAYRHERQGEYRDRY